MIEDVKLVVCDIDGTLVQTNRVLTNRTKDVIKRLHKHGIYFGIASGRSIEQQLQNQAREWGFDFDFEVIIGMNGSELYDGIAGLHHDYFKLKKEWIKEIIELLEPFDLNPFIYFHDKMLCAKVDEETQRSSKRNGTGAIAVEDISLLYAEDNAKIMFRMSEDKMEQVEKFLLDHPSDHYKAFKTQMTMLEFVDRRVSKAVALTQFCKMNNLELNQVVSFGDMTNDNEMLMCSGWGVCLINGGNDTKAIANEITAKSNDEDGFAQYMEENFLKTRGW